MKHIMQKYSKGQVTIIVALTLTVLLGMIGLAVDSGLAYGVKAKLDSALDAASLAGAKALSQGTTQAEQETSAKAAANKFFHANYPNDYLGSTVTEPTITVTFLPPPPNCTPPQCGTIVEVSASATRPLTFMQAIIPNIQSAMVGSSAKAGRQTLDLAFVVDITGSMSSVGSSVRSRAQEFLDHLDPSSDRVSLISFNYGGVVNDAIRTTTRGFDRTTMKSHIQSFNFSGNTNFGEGFWHARNQLNSVPTTPLGNRSNLRVILFFTDGAPNTFASTFPVRKMSTPDSSCSGSNPTCNCSSSINNSGFCTSPTNRACTCGCTGSLVTGDGNTGSVSGMNLHETTSGNAVTGSCNMGNNIISNSISNSGIYQLPSWYAAPHSNLIPSPEFQVAPQPSLPPQLRTISTTPSFTAVNRASRNLAEEMAWTARNEGIYVFVLGLGDLLHGNAGPDNEMGERLLMCMANTDKEESGISVTPLSRCYASNQTNNLNQPTGAQTVGSYCWAKDDPSLKYCYDKLASQILRLLSK
ncbi:MAG: TadE/TadG family protein [Methylophilaceae bacterium]|jgi:Putative Flp pilus-assembly TadE/G-like/von Willebrand factor type A domain